MDENSLGLIRLEVRFEPPPPGDKTSGVLHVTVKEARNLQATSVGGTADPYVKLYLSKDGKDIKNTKQKTKHQRATLDPLFEERLIVYLQAGTALDESVRLQITLWDNGGKLASNECMGGLSFSLQEIASTANISGWFELLPEEEGRQCNVPFTDVVGDHFTMKRSGSSRSLSMAPKGLKRMTGSFRKSLSKLGSKKEDKTGSMADLSTAGTTRGRASTLASSRALSVSRTSVDTTSSHESGRPDLGARVSKPSKDDDASSDFGGRFAKTAPKKSIVNDDDDAPTDFGGRIQKKGPPPAVDDDDGPGDFGGRVSKPSMKAQDDDDGPGSFGGRIKKASVAKADDDDDGPGNFGGRIKPATRKPADDDDDGPGSFGGRITSPKKAPSPDDDDEGALPGDFGGRLKKASAAKVDDDAPVELGGRMKKASAVRDDDDTASVSSYVPASRSDAKNVPVLSLPAKHVDDDDLDAGTFGGRLVKAKSENSVEDFDPESMLPADAGSLQDGGGGSYHGSTGSLNADPTPAPSTLVAASKASGSVSNLSQAARGEQLSPARRATSTTSSEPPSGPSGGHLASLMKSGASLASASVVDEPEPEPPRVRGASRASEGSARRRVPPNPRASVSSVKTASTHSPADDDIVLVPAASAASAPSMDDGIHERTNELERIVDELRERERELIRENANLQRRLGQESAAREEAQEQLDALQSKKDKGRDLDKLQQLTKLQEEARRLRTEAREAKEQRDAAVAAQKELEAKVEDLQRGQEAQRLAGMDKKNAELHKQIEAVESKNADLNDENHDLRKYIDRLLVQLLELDVTAIERAAID
eukprot:m.229789 g.229789  ORF g.229789 m.229789 type:complete len:823 (-) comp11956_c0_seq1:1019-3487(-)